MSTGNDLKHNPKYAVVDLEFVMDVVEYDEDEDDCRRALKDAQHCIVTDYLDDYEYTAREKKFITLWNKILEDFKELLRFREQCEIEGPDKEKQDKEKPVVEEKQDTEQSEKQFMDSFHTLY